MNFYQYFFISLLTLLLWTELNASDHSNHLPPMTDAEMRQFAQSHTNYQNVGELFYANPAEKIPDQPRGCAVYLGGKTVLTAAHCICPYLEFDAKGSLNLQIQNRDDTYSKFAIQELRTLDDAAVKSGKFDNWNDIALLKLTDKIPSLQTLNINDIIPSNFSDTSTYDRTHGQLAVAQIGYPSSGDSFNSFSMYDHKKRGFISKIYDTRSCCGKINVLYTKPAGQITIGDRDYNACHFSKFGYSGGGAFTLTGELIGINLTGRIKGDVAESVIYKIHSFYVGNIAHPLMIKGYQMPFGNNLPDSELDNGILSLSPHKAWIEKTRKEFDEQ